MANATEPLSPLLLLHAEDNVFVARCSIEPNEIVAIDGKEFRISAAIPLGHKVARYALARGTPILKYGAPIGSATQDVQPGEHVHLHNMQSDYMPTHTRQSSIAERPT